jgi:hypothetical protein
MLILVSPRRLPAGLDHAGDIASEVHFADLGARQAELLEGSARPPGDRAAVALAGRVGVAGSLQAWRRRALSSLFLKSLAIAFSSACFFAYLATSLSRLSSRSIKAIFATGNLSS